MASWLQIWTLSAWVTNAAADCTVTQHSWSLPNNNFHKRIRWAYKTSDFEINYYERAQELAIKRGWITMNLVQRTFRLSYGYVLSIVEALQHTS
ncbi:hypothetical protein CJO09_05180 [Neopusillimonas maritima]|uniref:FtsK gamma domain-containing protein n=1 Tax=Neopusillimonas maritima TaxID=2026239 RepID=A0A3A1YRW0_9BURK|nr:hypothetical protein CJO09_05180 [Neopusillimonas maritima]RIY38757.1 hypothetical protein CJP73_16290 [Neopusillimonas maritima]